MSTLSAIQQLISQQGWIQDKKKVS